MTLWCLHGFLGQPSDWDLLRDAGIDVRTVDVYALDPAAPSLPDAQPTDAVLGYSMGGRIALELLLAQPFAKAVIVSSGLNLDDDAERAKRRAADDAWARRFEREAWTDVLRDWNAQPVFAHDAPRPRDEQAFDRAALARALRAWSPGTRAPLAPRLRALEADVLWIAGEKDVKYAAVATYAASQLPRATLRIIAGAGHRVPWERPEEFVTEVRRFLGVP